ncbi:hypothetical protein QQY84_03670 [Streptococcus suis]|uniref:hypothetical protein n=1 Tax=Streptococcus suis TaxID=1307 RepID=UPI000D0BC194|nr:hypothetical protein [Streptococcus suis]MBS7854630.1 hypothetical protein [Streptococcus suis]MBS7977689.1 hypothetical protein [Streptococcus suis]MDG3109148.1 hypothetical protein [Streptococcus suis]MDG3147972.1 hypothetical protein [Streptococcus suis]MDG3170292.1 hypothetical protein [Streptococcus suis]
MRYRKKPVEIEAVKLEDNKQSIINAIEFVYNVGMETNALGMDFEINKVRSDGGLIINTLEGNMLASFGDYIIKGIAGEFYPCKPDIFIETYEPVEG